jgi:hypothetical protein
MSEDHVRIQELLAGYVLDGLSGEDAVEADRLLSEHVPSVAMGPDDQSIRHYRTRTALPVPPPPGPDSIGPTLSPVPASGPRGWRKFFAIARIVFGFLFVLTIPGWVGLLAYRKWKAGERDEPKVLIAWGAIMSSLFAVGLDNQWHL